MEKKTTRRESLGREERERGSNRCPKVLPHTFLPPLPALALNYKMSPQRDESRLLPFRFSSCWAVGNRLFLERQDHFQICAVMSVEVGAAGSPPMC